MKNVLYIKSFFLVLLSGFIWSVGVVIVRNIIDEHLYAFEYLFLRGITTSILIIFYLFLTGRLNSLKCLVEINFSDFIGGFFLAVAFIGFIFSIINTTVAITLFLIGTIPFIAAILGYIIIGEVLKFTTLFSILVSFLGIIIMSYNDLSIGNFQGIFFGLLAALGFASYTVTIRLNPNIIKFKVVMLAGIFCSIFSFFSLGLSLDTFYKMPIINHYLSLLHGIIIGFGFICFSFGAKYLPSAELTFLTLLEVIVGIFWAWAPFLGIQETPSSMVLVGGLLITIGIIIYGLNLIKGSN